MTHLFTSFVVHWQNEAHENLGRFLYLSELTGQTIPVITRISLLIKTIQPDQSNSK